MATNQSDSAATTRQRLLEAAAVVFARAGIAGSTTRAIAAEAGVNEGTLFRHFQTKHRLLAAVVTENFGTDQIVSLTSSIPPTTDLRADLLALARNCEKNLKENFPLVRTMIGEIHHHDHNQEIQVYRGVFGPLKSAIIARLELAKVDNEFTSSPSLLADLFTAMLFTGALRCAAQDVKLEYTSDEYLEAAVEFICRSTTANLQEQHA